MGIFSGSFTAESGTVSVEIDGSSIISGSGDFYIHDIGKLEFSNEVPRKDESDPTAIVSKQGGMKLTVRDRMANGNSFFSYLNELELNEQLNAKVTVSGLDTLLAIDYRNIKYNARDEMVTLDFRPRWVWGQAASGASGYSNIEYPISDFYTTYATADYIYNFQSPTSATSFYGCANLYQMIESYMGVVYGSGFTTYIKSSERVNTGTGLVLQDIGAPPVADGIYAWLIPTGAGGRDFGVLATISRYSAFEGSAFGNAFGVNYYINRLYTGSDATATFRPEINYNFVEELDISRDKNDIRYIQNKMAINLVTGTVYSSSNSTTQGLTLNEKGSQQYTLDWSGCDLIPAISVAAGTGYFVLENTLSPTAYFANDVARNGVSTYARALGADGSQRISFKFRNALSLKPYQAFTLSSGAPAIFRASGASSVVYRPSRLYYDFKGDYVEGEAYAIGAV